MTFETSSEILWLGHGEVVDAIADLGRQLKEVKSICTIDLLSMVAIVAMVSLKECLLLITRRSIKDFRNSADVQSRYE